MLVNVALMVKEERGDGGKVSAFMSSAAQKNGNVVHLCPPMTLFSTQKAQQTQKRHFFFYTAYHFASLCLTLETIIWLNEGCK